jgi:hypothetical protein
LGPKQAVTCQSGDAGAINSLGQDEGFRALCAANEGDHYSVLRRINKEADDGLFAKRLGRLQPVQALNEYEARAVSPY